MKSNYLALIVTPVIFLFASSFSFAHINAGSNSVKTPASAHSITAACSEATAQSDLAVNNVRCRILMGDMWWDLANGVYEIPKGGGVHSIFAGSLWIGGVDVGGQLKVAAQTYRQTGNDFWPGPLDTTNASVTLETCSEYDKHFRITRKEVENFVTTGVTTPAIIDWPGNGDQSKGQATYLAPFYDANADGVYTPSAGDYPGYDLVAGDGYGDCAQVNCIPVDQLFGDETIWWVFNDKGNIHNETGGEPIGLEIRAQAFGFFTDDEINNMTFYNYRIFNRSSFQVDSCYFGVWCDADLGCATDDYVGCDVKRGLGYTYNGDNDDDVACGNSLGYGVNPPAVGIDFFRGPIADSADGKDNDRNCQIDEACEQIIMSGFLYYDNITGPPNGNPVGATHFYRYLKMQWGDGNNVEYGGNGYQTGGPVCNFMYPGNPTTDEHDWGIGGNCSASPTLSGWDEVSANNTPQDRRMLESAGPFTLKPGALNVITTGVVWARANSGGAQASVKLLQIVDDKAQALFDNCFKVLDGPNAPDVTVQELNNKVILYLSNTDPNSNNYNENYTEFDPLISLVDASGNTCSNLDSLYRFEGYKIYQLKHETVSANDLDDPDVARLIYQCDVKNGVNRLINYEFDQSLGAGIPVEKVNGADLGLSHSIRVTTDAFATGSPNLVNHKTYYYMAIAYGYNQFKEYAQDIFPDTSTLCDPAVPATTGQKKPYKQGRKNIKVYSAIPHNISPYNGGTMQHAQYGDGPSVTRIEGNGNGGMKLELSASTIAAIMASPEARTKTPTYLPGHGPINVRVIDPLNVPAGHDFTLAFDSANIANSSWTLTNTTTKKVVKSDKTIAAVNEQLLMNWGLSITIEQIDEPGSANAIDNGYIDGSISFSDPSAAWLIGLEDRDGPYYENWIRAGTYSTAIADGFQDDYLNVDDDQHYEAIINRTWAPYRLVACSDVNAGFDPARYHTGPGFKESFMGQVLMKDLSSVDIVLTSDKSKWSRAVVLEMCEDSFRTDSTYINQFGMTKRARKHDFRRAPSVDKNGSTATGPDNNDFVTGMGWFPGYAINLETGERLNIAFGENSALVNENGNDMLWNPTENKTATNYFLPWDDNTGSYGSPVFGGQHYIYVFGHNKDNDPAGSPTPNDYLNVPRYDGCKMIRQTLDSISGLPYDVIKRQIFRDCMWVNIPLLAKGHSLLSSTATIKLRVAKPYKPGYSPAYYQDGFNITYSDSASPAVNANRPLYTFSTDGIGTQTGATDVAAAALDQIRVVPNPYYAFSAYETSSLDNRVKITNLPEKCTVSIFNLSGTLIRTYKKGEAGSSNPAFNSEIGTAAGNTIITTWDGSIDWDMKNGVGIPIASGVYIVHVDVPDVGEKVIKWFGISRPIDLDSF